jgi:hypothetical protein
MLSCACVGGRQDDGRCSVTRFHGRVGKVNHLDFGLDFRYVAATASSI